MYRVKTLWEDEDNSIIEGEIINGSKGSVLITGVWVYNTRNNCLIGNQVLRQTITCKKLSPYQEARVRVGKSKMQLRKGN